MLIAVSDDVETWANIAARAAEVAAIVVGGWWAYTRFIRERDEWPRASLVQAVSDVNLGQGHVLLRVELGTQNAGRVLIEASEVRIHVYQVLPLRPEAARAIELGKLIAEDAVEASWPCLETHQQTWDPADSRIEPGETDEFGFDFTIPGDVETVFVWSYVRNARIKNREIGWQVSQYHDLRAEGDTGIHRVEAMTGRPSKR